MPAIDDIPIPHLDGAARAGRLAATVAAVAVAGATLAAGGCGGEEDFPEDAAHRPVGLTAEEQRSAAAYERRIQAHCGRVARSLVDPAATPTPRQEERAFAAADALLALAAEKPTAPIGPGQDLRLFVSDVTENLEGSNCDSRIIARLEQGLAGIPPS